MIKPKVNKLSPSSLMKLGLKTWEVPEPEPERQPVTFSLMMNSLFEEFLAENEQDEFESWMEVYQKFQEWLNSHD